MNNLRPTQTGGGMPSLRTPPLLLGATLLFWGWQTGFLWAGLLMAVLLELPRFLTTRWEFSDEEFGRIWLFCSVLFLATVVYAFTAHEGFASFSRWLQNPNPSTVGSAGRVSSETAASLFRWAPMVFFLFVTAQAYSARDEIPLTIISRFVRWRWQNAAKTGEVLPPPGINLGYPYFAVCLFAASHQANETTPFYAGMAALLTWALWSQRSRRYRLPVWLAVLALALGAGYYGQVGISRLQELVGTFNPQWLWRLTHSRTDPVLSRTMLGKIGRLKNSGRIVIRLGAPGEPPTYLREASYQRFNGVTWSNTRDDTVDRVLPADNDDTTWPLLPDKTNTSRVRITCYLPGRQEGMPVGVLPLPSGAGRLEHLPVFALHKSRTGSVFAEGPGVVTFDAWYGPGATADAAFDPDALLPRRRVMRNPDIAPGELPWRDFHPVENRNPDLFVPMNEIEALDRVIAELGIRERSLPEQVQAVQSLFQSRFTYRTWQDAPISIDTNTTPVKRFLLETRAGHCEYFASATVLLLRRLNIPARYAVGYAVHEAAGPGYVVRERDAHAWCLVWDAAAGAWQDFDTTPASWVGVESKRASALQRLGDWWSWLKLQAAKFRWSRHNWRGYILWIFIPALALLLWRILYRRTGRRQFRGRAAAAIAWPGLDSEFYLIERRLAGRGVARRPDEPFSAWVRRVLRQPGLAGYRSELEQLLRLHYRCRFDPSGLTAEDRTALKQGVHLVLERME